jgi:hypothetical protein
MAKVNQIYGLLNSINKQMWGKEAQSVNDLSGIISMGNTVLASEDNTDLFLGKLVDRIGKTIIRTLDLNIAYPSLYQNEFEFGAILRKLTVNPFDAIQNKAYEVGQDGFTPSLLEIHKPSVEVTYFKDSDTWKFQTTIPDDLLTTAFLSAEDMGNFVDAITKAMSDSMIMSINNMSRTAINNFIAEKIITGNNVINLLEMYNTQFSQQLTASAAMYSKEFYRYASTVIREYITYLAEESILYNNNGILRVTARDNANVFMLSKFRNGFDAYLLSDSFRDVFEMPLFKEVPYWQANKGSNGNNKFETNSSIKLIPSSQKDVENAADRYAVEQTGIVCVITDRQAIGIGLNKRRAGAFYNSIDGYENISSSANIMYYNDMSENGIIFVVADSVATPGISLDKSSLTFASSSAADQTITATTTPADATVTWKTSKASVATVSGGVVSAAGTGTCNITAEITVGGKKYTQTCAVTVG